MFNILPHICRLRMGAVVAPRLHSCRLPSFKIMLCSLQFYDLPNGSQSFGYLSHRSSFQFTINVIKNNGNWTQNFNWLWLDSHVVPLLHSHFVLCKFQYKCMSYQHIFQSARLATLGSWWYKTMHQNSSRICNSQWGRAETRACNRNRVNNAYSDFAL